MRCHSYTGLPDPMNNALGWIELFREQEFIEGMGTENRMPQ
jgi:hypothetical protein